MAKRLARYLWMCLRPLVQAAFDRVPSRVLRVVLYFIARPLRVTSVVVDGGSGPMRGSPRDTAVLGEYIVSGTYAPQMMAFLTGYFRRHGKGTFVDIGANTGFTSKPLLEEGVACICFEPDPENFLYLSENLRAHAAAGTATLHNLAAQGRPGEMSFERSAWNHGDHRIRVGDASAAGEYAEDAREVIRVACARLDDVLEIESLARPLVVKIDTQGSEVAALEGAERLLAAADLLVMEFWPYGIRRQGRSEQELIALVTAQFQRGHAAVSSRELIPEGLGSIATAVAAMQSISKAKGPLSLDVYLAKSS